ncbi:Cytochrome c oxidase assembly protein, partial [Pseudomonas syringae pv. spinaceae]
MTQPIASERLVFRLLMLVAIMFACGFALTPIYHSLRDITDEQQVDTARQIEVQFTSSNSAGMVWAFYPRAGRMYVHPGAANEMIFVAQN